MSPLRRCLGIVAVTLAAHSSALGQTPASPAVSTAGIRVSGRVVSADGSPLESVTVVLVPRNPGATPQVPPGRVFPNGAFFVVGVPPGEYELSAEGRADAGTELLTATLHLTAARVHLSGLVLTLRPPEGGDRPAGAAAMAATTRPAPPSATTVPEMPVAAMTSAPAGVTAGAMVPARGVEPRTGAAGGGTDSASRTSVVSRDGAGGMTVRATRIPEPLGLDGHLDEPVYGRVEPVDGFVQQVPREGEPASERTQVWVLFDDDTIYVSARCWDSRPDRIVANEMRRDNIGIYFNDNFGVALDTFHDRRNGFLFQTNPIGGITDGYITDEREHNRDWNTVWSTKSQRTPEGWTVEMAIPFKSLRYNPGGTQIWGINFRRIIQSRNEHAFLTRIPAALGGRGIYKMSSAATLIGIEPPGAAKNLEVKPYAISALTTNRAAEPAVSNDLASDIGVDVKYGVTRGLTADFTYNTDFAQVEDDEQQVNLTRFSLFFPEKREFFLEGQGIFAFGGATNRPGGGGVGSGGGGFAGPSDLPVLFFSRRIGLSDGESVPIQVGGRLTGRAGQYSIGLLTIRTEAAESVGAEATGFTVVRLKRDILRRSTIGIIGTNRTPTDGGLDSNQVFGADVALSFYESLKFNTYYAQTRTPELTGDDRSYRAAVDYAADRYGVQLDYLAVGEHFNPEVGFLRRKDFRRTFAQLRFSPRPAAIRAIRKLSWAPSLEYVTDGRGRLESRLARMGFQMDVENGDVWQIQYDQAFEGLDEDFDITDDVIIPIGSYRFQSVKTSYRLGPQRKFSGALSLEHGGFFGGTRTEVQVSRGRLELSPKLSLEPTVTISRVDVPGGRFTAKLLGSRVTFTATPRMFAGALVQFNSSTDAVTSNVRFRWEYVPGSDLFVVYSEGRNTEPSGFPALENRSFAVKMTRLFRF